MNPQLQQVLNDQFLGKKIIVHVQERDNKGKVIPNKMVHCTGICQYIGSNPYLNYDLQVTVDGMPIPIKHINDIILNPKTITIKKQL